MTRYLFALAVFLSPFAAYAQAQQPQSPREQAVTAKLIQEINNNLQCASDVVTLQQQIAKLQEELKTGAEKKEQPAGKKP